MYGYLVYCVSWSTQFLSILPSIFPLIVHRLHIFSYFADVGICFPREVLFRVAMILLIFDNEVVDFPFSVL